MDVDWLLEAKFIASTAYEEYSALVDFHTQTQEPCWQVVRQLKAAKRRIRNRESSTRSRVRSRQENARREQEVQALSLENELLREENRQLRRRQQLPALWDTTTEPKTPINI